jgi:hypothetical protein
MWCPFMRVLFGFLVTALYWLLTWLNPSSVWVLGCWIHHGLYWSCLAELAYCNGIVDEGVMLFRQLCSRRWTGYFWVLLTEYMVFFDRVVQSWALLGLSLLQWHFRCRFDVVSAVVLFGCSPVPCGCNLLNTLSVLIVSCRVGPSWV